jgi:hypothetical protein
VKTRKTAIAIPALMKHAEKKSGGAGHSGH